MMIFERHANLNYKFGNKHFWAEGYFNGVTFTSWSTNISKHSYTDFGIILTEQNIGLPSPKTYSVSIEGMDGSLDLSECFGEMKYENRTLKFTFESIDKITDWQAKMINISSFLHRQKMKIKTWSDPDFYYVGRYQIDECNSSSKLGKIVISCDCEPFKYKNNIIFFDYVRYKFYILKKNTIYGRFIYNSHSR